MTDEFFMYKYKMLRWNTLYRLFWYILELGGIEVLWGWLRADDVYFFFVVKELVAVAPRCVFDLNVESLGYFNSLGQDSLVPHWCPTRMAQLQPGWKIPGWWQSIGTSTNQYTSSLLYKCLSFFPLLLSKWCCTASVFGIPPGVYGHNYQDARRPPSIGYGARLGSQMGDSSGLDC